MVVLTIPYDSGLSLQSISKDGETKNVEIVKAQGGFIGFIGEPGEYSYKLSYMTPGLEIGVYGFSIGTFLLGGIYIGFEMTYQDKKNIKKQLAL